MGKVHTLNALLFAWIFMIPLELFVSQFYNTAEKSLIMNKREIYEPVNNNLH